MTVSNYLERKMVDELQSAPLLLTLDTDWCPDFVLFEMLDLIPRGICVTLFATNPSPALEAYRERGHEVCAHPNFLPGSTHGVTTEEVILQMRKLFPDARGVRSHSLVQSSQILKALAEAGFCYDCNLLLYRQNYVQTFRDWSGLIRVPYVWEDAVCLHEQGGFDPGEWLAQLAGPGLKIMNFHPLLIALNTNSAEARNYQALKKSYRDLRSIPERCLEKHKDGGEGIGTLFRGIVSHLARQKTGAAVDHRTGVVM